MIRVRQISFRRKKGFDSPIITTQRNAVCTHAESALIMYGKQSLTMPNLVSTFTILVHAIFPVSLNTQASRYMLVDRSRTPSGFGNEVERSSAHRHSLLFNVDLHSDER